MYEFPHKMRNIIIHKGIIIYIAVFPVVHDYWKRNRKSVLLSEFNVVFVSLLPECEAKLYKLIFTVEISMHISRNDFNFIYITVGILKGKVVLAIFRGTNS